MNKLKLVRFLKEVPQWDLALKLGMSQAQVSNIERGRIEVGHDLKIKIARALEVEIGEVFPEGNTGGGQVLQ
ncbi:MAG: helix-turn-helix transcriptional regulator [Thermodesulfobacteriota bacterium]|jgi:DNA-binding XRE family transcriptional regulator